MTLSADQTSTLKQIVSWYNNPTKAQYITLGGYAGTGKTTLIAVIKEILAKTQPHADKKLKIAFCSYTGRAVQNLKNKLTEQNALKSTDTISTIHGLIYDPIENTAGVIIGWQKKPEILADLIIIDEASMIDSDIWADLLSFNVPIIAVGDHGQLPPIKTGFNLMHNPHLKLENIHRQAKDNPIINLSILARTTGSVPAGRHSDFVIKYTQQDDLYTDASTDLLENYTPDLLILCGYNTTRVKINQFVRTALGFESPDPQTGDRVICLRNNHTKKIYNGMLGTIKSILPAKKGFYSVEIAMDDVADTYAGNIYAPQFNATQPINFTQDRAKIGEYDIFDFGYALTVHKAQGSQAQKVVLFEERFAKMTDEDWKKWLYTGVTRAQSELYIFGN